MAKALKSFRLGTQMIRRGADLSHLTASELRDLAKRGLAPREAGAARPPKSKTGGASAPRRKSGAD